MAWRPTRLTREQMEERRLAAGRLLRAGTVSQAEIAREVGVSRASVTRWQQRLARGGIRAPRLTAAQWRQVGRVLDRGAVAAGFETEQWTLRRVAAVIARRFAVRYHPRSLGRALRARGWSPQRPIARASERNDALVQDWLRRDWPRIKRGLAAAGVPWPSGMKQATRFGPASAPLGPPRASHRSCAE